MVTKCNEDIAAVRQKTNADRAARGLTGGPARRLRDAADLEARKVQAVANSRLLLIYRQSLVFLHAQYWKEGGEGKN